MRPLPSTDSSEHPELSVVAGVSPANPAHNKGCEHSNLAGNLEKASKFEVKLPADVTGVCRVKKPADMGLCRAIIAVVMSSVIRAQAQEPTPAPQTAGQLTVTMVEVIVTGSNIPTAEEVGPLPVDIYRKADIERLGVRTASDFVQKLPVNAGAAINENVTSGGDGRVEVNLRGILPKETLVLQDGRRLAPVGFAGDTVDLNMFPFGLIDHIDILKDGASAIYGSDAVDGVVNVWLIHRFRGLEIYASYGNTNLGFANDMGEERAYLLAGTGDDKTDIVVYAELYNRAAIYSRDADISANADFTPFGGLDLRSNNTAGHVGAAIFQTFVYQPSLNGGALTPTPHAFPHVFSDPQYVPLPSLPRKQWLFNTSEFTSAMPSADRGYLYGSLDHKICNQYLELFADFKYVRGFWDGTLAPAPFTPDVFTDARHPFGISRQGISVPIQNPFNPFTVPDYISPGGTDPTVPRSQISAVPPGTPLTTAVLYRGLEAGSRNDKITTQNYEFTGGLTGNLGEFGDYFKTWQWESGFRYNEDQRIERFGPIVNAGTLRAALLDTNPATAFNPFGFNQNSPAVIDKVFTTTQRFGTTSLALEDLKLYGDLWDLPAGPIAFAIGGEHRTERATDQPDALTASGQTIGTNNFLGNFGPTKGSRDVWSIYWEVRVPVTSRVWNCPGLYSLELGYQERYDNYSDFGASERPKFFVRWQPIDSALTFRASYNEAFHAPTLRDLFGGPLQGTSLVADSREVPPSPPFSGIIVPSSPSGNPNLQPETAYEWTYGAVVTPGKWWSPLQGLTISANFYHIDIRNVTVQLNPQFLVDHEDEFPGLVIRGPPNPPFQPFGPIVFLFLPEENLGRFIEEGWDYEAVYAFDTSRLGQGDWGMVTLALNGTYLDRAVLQPAPGAREKSVVGKFGAGFVRTGSIFGSGVFTHNRWYASLFYDGPPGSRFGGIDVGFIVHYIGDYWDNQFPNPLKPQRKVREWTTADFILNYTFNLPAAPELGEVPGYAKNIGKNGKAKEHKDKNVMPVSTAEYNPCGWRVWLNNTTITLGINNVFDSAPPFVAGSGENGYDEATANIKGRSWYVALTKRF
jgi:iron complex outermembrane receptor protein